MSDEPVSSEAAVVFAELLDEMRDLAPRMLAHPASLTDEQSRTEIYKWVFSITQVALECFVWGDVERPRFVDIVGATKKWGGDNTDAFYQHAAVGPGRTYRVTGNIGDAVYLSLTVYGGPDDGHYSERIVGTVNDRSMAIAEDGSFECWISPDEPADPGMAWIRSADDVVAAITRDYLADPTTGRRTTWKIERIHDPEDPRPQWRETDAGLAARMRTALTFIRDQAAIVPVGVGEPNRVDPPYPVPSATFGWAAGDAAYAMGAYGLADGEALVLRGRSPECVFWNLCLWNPLLHTYNASYDRVSINGTQVAYEPDGSWVIVIAAEDPGHPNWVSTQGHDRGLIWFRWFLPAETPSEIAVEVVPLAEVPA